MFFTHEPNMSPIQDGHSKPVHIGRGVEVSPLSYVYSSLGPSAKVARTLLLCLASAGGDLSCQAQMGSCQLGRYASYVDTDLRWIKGYPCCVHSSYTHVYVVGVFLAKPGLVSFWPILLSLKLSLIWDTNS